MIVFDTETTGLVQPEAMPLEKQPQIIEFAAIKLDDTLEEIDRISFLCRPSCRLPDKIVEITKLTDADLAGEKEFPAHYKKLTEFFLGQQTLVAHNLAFDRDLLRFELQRIGRVTQFPWPPEHKCTVELTYGLKGKRLTLAALHEIATDWKFAGAHRGMVDVEALVRVVKWMRTERLI